MKKVYNLTETGKAEILSNTCPIYRLPCSYTGLDAEIDNCDPPADVIRVDADAPQADGYTRYLLLSGEIVDINIDQFDFADWFQLSELDQYEA